MRTASLTVSPRSSARRIAELHNASGTRMTLDFIGSLVMPPTLLRAHANAYTKREALVGDVNYSPDYRGTSEMLRSPEMHAIVEAVALEAVPFARAISPDATPYGVGYIDKFEVHGDTRKVGNLRGLRAVAELSNNADYATSVELGSFDNPRDTGHHVLARTADYIQSRYGERG